MNLTRNDYRIIDFLYNKGCLTKIYALKLQIIADGTDLSIYKIRDAVKLFLNLGIINEGAKDVRAKTYYLTEKGQEIARENIEGIKKVMERLNEVKGEK